MVLASFSQILSVIFGAAFFIIGDIDLIKFKDELKSNSKVQSEPAITDKSLDFHLKGDSNVESELAIGDNSLNHHFKKDYSVIVGGKGKHLITEDNREIFDASSGAGVASIGYGNSEVIDAIHAKYNNGVHYLAPSF